MTPRPLENSNLALTPVGFGAFKIGRNVGIKYAQGYELPGDREVDELLRAVLGLGVNYFDTAPAYGVSEERIGRFAAQAGSLSADGRGDSSGGGCADGRDAGSSEAVADSSASSRARLCSKSRLCISTKVGETFEDGRSTYNFSPEAINASLARSRERLGVDVLDLVFIHAHADDMAILRETDAVKCLLAARDAGTARAIGFSGKTPEAALASLEWADAIMVEYHLLDQSHEAVIAEAAARGAGVIVKKGLASGRLAAREAVEFVLGNPGVTSLVVGTLNAEHLREIVEVAERVRG